MTNLSNFDLNLLRVLDALLKEHSTVKAGERIGLSQPAVSASLARLRVALGDQLFFRRGQKLAPTEYALSLQAPLHDILNKVGALIQGPSAFDPASAKENFRISGSDFFAELLMPILAVRFQSIAPSIRVHLVDLVPDGGVETLGQHEVDLALIRATKLPDWIDSQAVFQSPFSVIARKDNPRIKSAGLLAGDVVPIDLFCNMGHVLFSQDGEGKGLGDSALANIGRARNVVMTMPVFSGVYRAVSGSDLIALLPSPLARHVATSAGLDVFKPPIHIPITQIAMVWHRRYSDSQPHIWLREQVVDILAPLDKVL